MATFSAAQLDKFAGTKRITQETFDAAVRENIDEFEMEPQEALKSAVDEFSAQGVDLSNIIKTVDGGDITSHPATVAVHALQAAAAAGDFRAMASAANDIAAAAGAGAGSEGAALVLHRTGAAQAVVQSLAAAAVDQHALLHILQALAALLGAGSRELQADFLQAAGVPALQRVLSSQPCSGTLAAAALQAAAASAEKNEEGKAALMESGCGSSCLEVMQRYADEPEAVQAACAVLCALTNPDDDTQPGSRAFPNARALAKDGAAKQLVETLRGYAAQLPEVTAAVASALKQVAANEEICQEVAAVGGMQLILQILRTGMADVVLVRPLCALLRQLVNSDGNKTLLVESGGLELLAALLSAYSSNPGVLEQALGLLTNATLRNPEAASKALECGCLDAMLELIRVALASSNGKENRSATAVQRQACMAIRNSAARNPDVRAVLLDKGAEGLLRQLKAAYPSCADAGSAALRDLGLDNYNN